MIRFAVEQWEKNKPLLENYIRSNVELWNRFDYIEIVESVVEYIFNDGDDYYYNIYDSTKITEINNGDYQGTLLYVIPLKTYQPSESEYLMTFVNYGSCSGCDTLQSIQTWATSQLKEDKERLKEFVDDMMFLCLSLVQNTIKPYNHGWRSDDKYNHIEEITEYEGEDN